MQQAGPAYALNEEQKITAFEQGLKDANAIKYSISSKSDWDRLPIANQSFDEFYNIFSAYMNRFHTLAQINPRSNAQRRIANINSGPGSHGRGRGRGRGRGGRSHRGRGRHLRYQPFQQQLPLATSYTAGSNFQPKAKVYPPAVFQTFTREQKKAIMDLKTREGWINHVTPPNGFTIDPQTGLATPTNAMISAIRTASIGAATSSMATDTSTIQSELPPPPNGPPPVPPTITTNTNPVSTAGSQFSRSGTRTTTTSSINQVSIVNGRQIRGQIFDAQGNPLN